MIPWAIISRLGDVILMLPAAVAILIWLTMAGERRLASWWVVLFGAAMALTVATKVAFIGWGWSIHALDFTGFSGHVMRATAVLPVLAYLLLQQRSARLRVGGVLAGFLLAAGIGAARVALHAHSISEVVLGGLLGTTVSLGFIWLCGSLRVQVFNRTRAKLSMAVMLAASCAGPTPTQQWLTDATLFVTGHDKPFVRDLRVRQPGSDVL
jgi:membrane-associated phospholipid phosphatase